MSAVLQESNILDFQPEKLEVSVAVTPEIRKELGAGGALAVAQAYEIDCPEVAQALADERKAWAKRIDRLEAMKKDLLAPLKTALADMQGRLSKWFDPAMADLVAARELGEQKLLAWQQKEQARVAAENAAREAEARRVRQEAEAKAAAERARAEEQAREANRKAAEAAEAQRKALAEGNARAAAAAAAEAAKQAEKAQAALENGEAKAQEAQMQAAAQVSAAPVATVAKIAGQSTKETWGAELQPGVTADQAKRLICEAIVAGRSDLLALIEVDTAPRGALNKLAAALKGAMNVPGYIARASQSIAGSRK